jgi:hydrogenase nickel incorporation protein HypA/HybF
MHELSVTQRVLEMALEHAARPDGGVRRVSHLTLVIGQLSSIVDDSVQFYWDIISRGTPAEGATLHFKRIPARFECLKCGEVYLMNAAVEFACPVCGSVQVRVVAGEEFYLESIDVET